MANEGKSVLLDILRKHETRLLADWIRYALDAGTLRPDLMKEDELREQSRRFLTLLTAAAQCGTLNTQAPEWSDVRDFLAELSRARVRQGFTPSETATFVFSLKHPLFDHLREELGEGRGMLDARWDASELLDKLGLFTIEVYQKGREELIQRQQHEVLELSTPVVALWDGVLALPLIGTLDSERTQIVMENLLSRIVETGAALAIIDITGVPTVDTMVAQHLLKTIAAARLMGADCIISGIRPQIAQTIVHLGVDLQDVITKASLADAFALALRRQGLRVTPAPSA